MKQMETKITYLRSRHAVHENWTRLRFFAVCDPEASLLGG
jgi:hypothetical protein